MAYQLHELLDYAVERRLGRDVLSVTAHGGRAVTAHWALAPESSGTASAVMARMRQADNGASQVCIRTRRMGTAELRPLMDAIARAPFTVLVTIVEVQTGWTMRMWWLPSEYMWVPDMASEDDEYEDAPVRAPPCLEPEAPCGLVESLSRLWREFICA